MRQIYTHTWETCTAAEHVKIRSKTSAYPVTTTQRTKEVFTTFDGSFEVDIDTEAIAKMLIGRAAHSTSGKSRFLQGMCSAKRLSAKPGATRTKEYPVNLEQYEVIPD